MSKLGKPSQPSRASKVVTKPEHTTSLEAITHHASQEAWSAKYDQLYLDVVTIAIEAHNAETEPEKALLSIAAKIDTYARDYRHWADMASRLIGELPEHPAELEQHAQTFRESAKLFNPFECYEDAIASRQDIESLITEVDMLDAQYTSKDVIETFYPTEDQ
ncbi:hypothetical protein N9A96_00205 [bacterium]|nr:hypothetical protein [bacterium]